MNETRRKPTTGRQSPSLFDKWHGIFYMPSRTGGHTRAFDNPVTEHCGESRNVQFVWDSNRQHVAGHSRTEPSQLVEDPSELTSSCTPKRSMSPTFSVCTLVSTELQVETPSLVLDVVELASLSLHAIAPVILKHNRARAYLSTFENVPGVESAQQLVSNILPIARGRYK